MRPVFRGLLAILAIATPLMMLGPRAARAANLTVVVTGLENNKGTVHIAVWDKAKGFTKPEAILKEGIVKPDHRRAQWRFTGLKPGAYAVATFHDANANGEFDQGLFGIPLELYGFSNGAHAVFSAPAFSDAAIHLPPQGLTITIDLGHGDDEAQ